MYTQANEPQSSCPLSPLRRSAALSRFIPSRFVLSRFVPSRLFQDESGQDLIEYALIACLIGLAAVTSAHGVAVSVSSAINIVGSGLTSSL